MNKMVLLPLLLTFLVLELKAQVVSKPVVINGGFSTNRFAGIELTISEKGIVSYGNYQGRLLPISYDDIDLHDTVYGYEAGKYIALVYAGYIAVDMIIQTAGGTRQYTLLEGIDGKKEYLRRDIGAPQGGLRAIVGYRQQIILIYNSAVTVFDVEKGVISLEHNWDPKKSKFYSKGMHDFQFFGNHIIIEQKDGDELGLPLD